LRTEGPGTERGGVWGPTGGRRITTGESVLRNGGTVLNERLLKGGALRAGLNDGEKRLG